MTAIPSAFDLDDIGRAHLLQWLEVDVILGRTITADSWRDAWARAADYQTVVDGRAYLAEVTP